MVQYLLFIKRTLISSISLKIKSSSNGRNGTRNKERKRKQNHRPAKQTNTMDDQFPTSFE